jgi:hypothetical protein
MSLYLCLNHGRLDPNAEMDGWGFEGPVFGSFISVKQIYGSTIRACYAFGNKTESFEVSKEGLTELWGGFYSDIEYADLDSHIITMNDSLRDRLNVTYEILRTPAEDLPLLINHELDWVRAYAKYRMESGK